MEPVDPTIEMGFWPSHFLRPNSGTARPGHGSTLGGTSLIKEMTGHLDHERKETKIAFLSPTSVINTE